MVHPMMPDAVHDELAGQLFVRDLKAYILSQIDPAERRLTEAVAGRMGADASVQDDVDRVRDEMFEHDAFRTWFSFKRTSQELLWSTVADSLDRQMPALNARAEAIDPKGSLRLDPDFVPPKYITRLDVHLMPGGYAADEGDVRQGALMDRGGAIFMMGRNGGGNGGMMNDARGASLVSHILEVYPDLKPRRILEMGCGVGVSATAVARHFPDAEIHAIDIGASMLRYAHARAEHLGAAIHFSQQNAEATDFEDGSFDLVFTAAVFHESSHQAIRKMVAEARRLLRPGGVMAHVEVSVRYAELDMFQKMAMEYESGFNNEPCWREAMSADYGQICRDAGFCEVNVGFQKSNLAPQPGRKEFFEKKPALNGYWYVASARK